jgi:hypothetical protein
MPAAPTPDTHLRPQLSLALPPSEFLAWYWLKSELIAFCRAYGISQTGSKPDLQARIHAALSGRPPSMPDQPVRRNTVMPQIFHAGMRIGKGWRCGPALGAYFRATLGNGFHFNAAMRDFIHHGEGKTLLEAEQCYLASIQPGAVRPQIARQLEYNQHFRDYFAAHPTASRQDAIQAWWLKRNSRKTPALAKP